MNQPLNHMSLHPAATSTPVPQRPMAVSQPNLGKPCFDLELNAVFHHGAVGSEAALLAVVPICAPREHFFLPLAALLILFATVHPRVGFTLLVRPLLQLPFLKFFEKSHRPLVFIQTKAGRRACSHFL